MPSVIVVLSLVSATLAQDQTMGLSSLVGTGNPFSVSPGFDIQKVAELAQSLPSHSWEYGAAAEALLELYNPELSVFGATPFPVRSSDPGQVNALSYAASKIQIGTGENALSQGDGAVGDPAALGVSAVMLGKSEKKFADAAGDQLAYTVNSAPRFYNGAISQRTDTPELWADFMYMAPPFLAYYAADANNGSLLMLSVQQCTSYHQILVSNNTSKNWAHIVGSESQDLGLWSTGNGWAAGGMARVLATLLKAPLAQAIDAAWCAQAIGDLSGMIKEILDGAMDSPAEGGLLRNYLDDTTTGHGFPEISGSTMLAAVAYRMAVLQPDMFGSSYVGWADGVRKTLGGNNHVTNDGVVTPAVNPLNWQDTTPFTRGSPEGQAFVVLMYAAWRDCVDAGKCSADGSERGLMRRFKHSRIGYAGAHHRRV